MKEAIISPIFCTPIYSSSIDREFTKKEIEFFKKHKKQSYFNAGNRKSKNNYILEEAVLKNIKSIVIEKINEYIENVICPKDKIEPYITQSWLAITEKNESHHSHNHPNSYISGVIYINAKEESDSIVFVNKKYEQIKVYAKSWNIFNSENWWVSVKTGDILLFPSDLEHRVNTKEDSDSRISLAFNVFIKGTLGSDECLTGLKLK